MREVTFVSIAQSAAALPPTTIFARTNTQARRTDKLDDTSARFAPSPIGRRRTQRRRKDHHHQACEYVNPDAIAQDELGDWNATRVAAPHGATREVLQPGLADCKPNTPSLISLHEIRLRAMVGIGVLGYSGLRRQLG